MFPVPCFGLACYPFPCPCSVSLLFFISLYLLVFSVLILWLLLPVLVLLCVLFMFGPLVVVFIMILTFWFWPSFRVFADNSCCVLWYMCLPGFCLFHNYFCLAPLNFFSTSLCNWVPYLHFPFTPHNKWYTCLCPNYFWLLQISISTFVYTVFNK